MFVRVARLQNNLDTIGCEMSFFCSVARPLEEASHT